MVLKLRSGFPRQLSVIKENRRCSILFHLLVPGGRWQTVMGIRNSFASLCSSIFHRRRRWLLLPPPSAVKNTTVKIITASIPPRRCIKLTSIQPNTTHSNRTPAPTPHTHSPPEPLEQTA